MSTILAVIGWALTLCLLVVCWVMDRALRHATEDADALRLELARERIGHQLQASQLEAYRLVRQRVLQGYEQRESP